MSVTLIKSFYLHFRSFLINPGKFSRVLIFVAALAVLFGCKSGKKSEKKEDNIAATVYGKNLYYSGITIDFPQGISDAERSNLINSYVEHWVRKEILAHDATKSVKDLKKINRLTEDYKKSLIIEDFKERYIQDNLDSVITKKQLNEFYDANKNQFVLDHSVANVIYAKFKDNKYNLDKFYENWKKKKFKYVSGFCEKNSDEYLFKKDNWYDLEKVKKELPSFLRKNKDSYEVQINKKGYEYFLKVFETRHKNENIPLDMVKKKVEKLILQKRKSDILDKYIEELYKKEIANNKIKVYR